MAKRHRIKNDAMAPAPEGFDANQVQTGDALSVFNPIENQVKLQSDRDKVEAFDRMSDENVKMFNEKQELEERLLEQITEIDDLRSKIAELEGKLAEADEQVKQARDCESAALVRVAEVTFELAKLKNAADNKEKPTTKKSTTTAPQPDLTEQRKYTQLDSSRVRYINRNGYASW